MAAIGAALGVPFRHGGGFLFAYENLLRDCDGIVGDYGQPTRPYHDMQVASFNGVDQYRDTGIQSAR